MAQQSWQRQYLTALLTSKRHTIQGFESVDFFGSIANETPSSVQECLLYRLFPQLQTIPEALTLLASVRHSGWDSYAARILARISDTNQIIRNQPELAKYFQTLRE